jgi:hypothetical protein
MLADVFVLLLPYRAENDAERAHWLVAAAAEMLANVFVLPYRAENEISYFRL